MRILRQHVSTRRRGVMLLLGMFTAGAVATLAQTPSSRLAIDFGATDLHGAPFKGSSLKGRIVLLDFWAVWCPPCIEAFPVLGRLDTDLKERGFQILGIAVYSGTVEDVKKFVEDHQVTYQVVLGDEDLVERFGVIGYPTYFLISTEGAISKKYVGAHPDLYDQIKVDVDALSKRSKSKEER